MQNVKTPLPMGTIIQRRYFVQGLLGSGCFGSVYLVRDQRVTHNIFNHVVLKEVINPNKHERYQITFEGMLLKLLHHRALPSVFRVISDDKHHRVYILMDYIEGPNLEMLWLQQPEKRFSLPEVVSIMTPIIDAVIYLHNQQIPLIHQDIKPTNIIVPKAGGKAVLVDFGIGKKHNLTSTNRAVHPPLTGYEAPEHSGGETDTRTDIYGLGAIFYTLLTGIIPADALSRKEQLESKNIDPLDQVDQVVLAIPPPVAEAIRRAMSLSSNDRFPTVEQFWRALGANAIEQKSTEYIIAPSAPSHPPVVFKEAVTRPAPVSTPKRPSVSQIGKPGALRAVASKRVETRPTAASVPQQPHSGRSRKLGVPILLLLVLFIGISLGVVLWASAVGHSSRGSATPTPALLHRATPHPSQSSILAPTPGLPSTISVNIAASYNGTIYNVAANVSTKMSLTVVHQNQGNISGYFTGLQVNSPFKGNVDASKHIQFIVTDPARQRTLSFDAAIQTDGNLAGSYCSLDQQRHCAGEYGIWSAAPAS